MRLGFTFLLALAMSVHLFGSPYLRSAMSASVSPAWTTYSSLDGAGSGGGAGATAGGAARSAPVAGPGTVRTPASRPSASVMRSAGDERGAVSGRTVRPDSFFGAASPAVPPGFGFPYMRS